MTVREQTRKVVLTQWPIMAVVVIFLVAFGLVVTDFWRRGSLLIGVGVAVAAALRLVLSDSRAGLLVVRGKATDVTMMTLVAAAMVYMAWTIDPLGTG
jgi:Protein of unknown function (DUF3017)